MRMPVTPLARELIVMLNSSAKPAKPRSPYGIGHGSLSPHPGRSMTTEAAPAHVAGAYQDLEGADLTALPVTGVIACRDRAGVELDPPGRLV